MKLFVDTGALAALGWERDTYHPRTKDALARLPPGASLSTSNLVFAETMTLLASRYGQDAALGFGDMFFKTRMFTVVHYSDESLERAGVATMRRFRDKRLSFVDATTIALVKSEGLDAVFGFDEDFARCGVALYPKR